MAPLTMHLAIGERVYPRLRQLPPLAPVYGSFLLGCLLADVNAFSDIDRRATHFVGRPHEDGEDAFAKGSETFVDQVGTLLRRPWADLSGVEQAFVAGYLCHLASDEAWKEIGWRALWAMGISSLDELPVPGGVLMTAYSLTSAELYLDFPAIRDSLKRATVPDVLTHVPHRAFCATWDIVRAHVMDGHMLKHVGQTDAEIRARRRQREEYLDEAISFARQLNDAPVIVEAAVRRSLERMPRLWAKAS
jgi:hypothetical protein